MILNQSQRDYYKARKDRPESKQEGKLTTNYHLDLQAEKDRELEKLEAKSVGRQSMMGFGAMKDVPKNEPTKKRFEAKRRRQSDTSSL